MNRSRTALAARITGGLLATAAVGAVAGIPAAHAATTYNCPTGYVCIYPGTTSSQPPTYKFASYGPHAIHNQYGSHLVVNAQYGGAGVDAKSGANGTGTTLDSLSYGGPTSKVMNLSPVNSFVLTRPASCYPRCV